jgi:hypothetical protein
MGKSIRSKSKRKFRAIRRRDTYGPAAKIKQFEALSNLRRCIGNQRPDKQSVDNLRAMISGEASTTEMHAGNLPDASDALGLAQYKDDMDKAEKDAIERRTGHFSFKTTAAPDYQEPVLWKTLEPDTKFHQRLVKEAELAHSGMVIDTGGSSDASKEMARRQRAHKKLKARKRKGRKNTISSGYK